ncbi:MAG: hypothetical protein C0504_02830 [Candidatus Solibacter sp.]|nr:hypothetical protein [Candidatus Solibacter sp.]
MKLAVSFILIAASASSAYAQELRAGAAQVVITPPTGTPMAGYYHPRASTGVHDDLHAKAIVLRQGNTTLALIACDLIHVPEPVVEASRKLIASETGIPARNVMISATHAHTGPVIPGGASRLVFGGKEAELAQAYAAGLPVKIAGAVKLAIGSLQPARIRAGAGIQADLTFNRRFHMTDGTVGWNPGKMNPRIVRPAGPIDPQVGVLSIESAAGAPLATLVNYALHLDTVGGLEISADYPYTMAETIAAARPAITLFTLGCAGNLNHIDVKSAKPQKGHQEAARIGAALGREVVRTLGSLEPVQSRLAVKTAIVDLPLAQHDPGEAGWARQTAATYGQQKPAPFLELVKAFRIIDVEARSKQPLRAEVQAIRLGGDTALVALPGEIFTELGLAIKQNSPFKRTIVIQLANASIGYVPDRKAFGEGNYEAVSARCAVGSGERLVEAAIGLLNKLRH